MNLKTLRLSRAIALALAQFAATPALAQQFAIGIIGGASTTSGFPNKTVTGAVSGAPGPVFSMYSSQRDYLVGALVEAALPAHFSVEADGIYRPLDFRSYTSSVPGSASSSPSNTVLTWQFPVLLKYRFARIPVPSHPRAFLEAGPSFRIASNRNDTQPSNHGVVAGLGVAIGLSRFTVSPALRYTRWAADPQNSIPFVPATSPNQVEFVLGLSLHSSRAHE